RLERLGQKVESTMPHASDRQFNGSHRGEEYYGETGVRLASRLQYLQALTVGHLLIRENGVVVAGCQMVPGFLHPRRLPGFVLVLPQVRKQDAAHVRF